MKIRTLTMSRNNFVEEMTSLRIEVISGGNIIHNIETEKDTKDGIEVYHVTIFYDKTDMDGVTHE